MNDHMLAGLIALMLFLAAATAVSLHPRYRHFVVDDHPGGCPEHYRCEHPDCDLVICYRHDGPCTGTVAPGCRHYDSLATCDDHRLQVCAGCRIDAADDAGLLDRGYGGGLR